MPSMLMATLSGFKTLVKSLLVNCDPWSVLKISGTPIVRASSRASMQKAASRVRETFQERTYRLYQSMTAVR